jgi:hypothetical protein
LLLSEFIDLVYSLMSHILNEVLSFVSSPRLMCLGGPGSYRLQTCETPPKVIEPTQSRESLLPLLLGSRVLPGLLPACGGSGEEWSVSEPLQQSPCWPTPKHLSALLGLFLFQSLQNELCFHNLIPLASSHPVPVPQAYFKVAVLSYRCNSVIEYLPSMCEALGFVFTTENNNNNKIKSVFPNIHQCHPHTEAPRQVLRHSVGPLPKHRVTASADFKPPTPTLASSCTDPACFIADSSEEVSASEESLSLTSVLPASLPPVSCYQLSVSTCLILSLALNLTLLGWTFLFTFLLDPANSCDWKPPFL